MEDVPVPENNLLPHVSGLKVNRRVIKFKVYSQQFECLAQVWCSSKFLIINFKIVVLSCTVISVCVCVCVCNY